MEACLQCSVQFISSSTEGLQYVPCDLQIMQGFLTTFRVLLANDNKTLEAMLVGIVHP